jgi:hypothetical protein
MADTAKRLVGPSLLTASEQTLYTVPAATTAILRGLRVANNSTSTVTLTVSIGADAAGTRLYSSFDLLAKSVHDWSGFLVLAAGETLRGYAGTANQLVISVSGVEVT